LIQHFVAHSFPFFWLVEGGVGFVVGLGGILADLEEVAGVRFPKEKRVEMRDG